MLGMEKHAAPISLGSFDLLRGRNICGSLFGGLKSKLDIPILVDHYLKKVLYMYIYVITFLLNLYAMFFFLSPIYYVFIKEIKYLFYKL